MSRRQKVPRILLSLVLLAATILAAIPFEPTQVAEAASTKALKLRVVSARTESRWIDPNSATVGITEGAAVTHYKFIINENNTGNPLQDRYPDCAPTNQSGTTTNPDYPANCNWPSIHPTDAYSAIVAQGDETAFANNRSLDLSKLKNGNYLVSVWADGFKIDGQYFTLPLNGPAGATLGVVTVKAQPFPLPLATVKLQVFEDANPVNGQYDVPGENPLVGYEGHIADVFGIVKSDWYGNPICTTYQTEHGLGQFDPVTSIATNDPVVFGSDGRPVILQLGGKCLSDVNGEVTIPNIGPNRYTATVVPPNGSPAVQTTTLEGNHDYDVWVSEGATGYDTEMIGPNGEPVPAIPFGYVMPTTSPTGLTNAPTTGKAANTGGVKGTVWASKTYIPQQGGLPYTGTGGGVGAQGTKLDKPIDRPWIALNDLQNGDRPVYVGRGDSQGKFTINNVPDGDYAVAYWDAAQDYLIEFANVSVSNGQVTDMNNLLMAGWWTTYEGRVCIDQNRNGKCEATEPGIPNLTLQLLTRSNSAMERGQPTATTDARGNYAFKEAYPLSAWLVMQLYNDRFKTIGVTYQADNQPTETTVLTAAVDVGVFPVIGIGGRMDWALQTYDLGQAENGGIVGTVVYDTTRNETDARFAAVESYQPGIPDVEVQLWAPTPCGTNPNALCDASRTYKINADGSYRKSTTQPLNSYISEHWERPTNCVPRDVNGQSVVQKVTPVGANKDCIEAPFMGVQYDPNSNKVNGNYALVTTQRDPVTGRTFGRDADGNLIEKPLPAGDYLVEVVIPKDKLGKPMYQVTKEEDVNVFTGDQYAPQVPPPPCAGPLHTVDVKGMGADGPNAVNNPGFVSAGGSPYEGQEKPLCNIKLVTLQTGKSVVPTFNLFTPVPIPGKMWGLINDDLNLSTNPQDIMFGEKRGLANVPVGVYDYSNRLITTVMSDPNGFYELLLPSTSTYNCPLPAGPCPNVYRLVGNDPGQPGNLNAYYNPQYKTISASFEVWPGLVMPADHAPIPIGAMIATPGSQNNQPAQCKLDGATPQIFTVNKPYVKTTDATSFSNNVATYRADLVISGDGFGNSQGNSTIKLGNTNLPVSSWNNNTIVVNVPTSIVPGEYQLTITRGGQISPNGLTFHILGTGYNPTVYEVGPGKQFNSNNYKFPYTNGVGAIQAAINAASATNAPSLVVVYPGTNAIPTNPNGNSLFNANGAYFENLLINAPIKLQGVGPGGITSKNETVNGSVLDGLGFGSETYGDAWRTNAAALQWSGNQTLYEGAVVTILARDSGAKAFGNTYKAKLDGFLITGGDQMGQNTKANSVRGGIVTTQGGGIFANAFAKNLQITNNVLRSNGGAYGGAIRLGTPFIPGSNNTDIHIAYNRVIANGGTNLAGGIGIFNGSDNYEIDHNDICGNYSGEYGGGIGQYGKSPNGKIHDNRIYFNASFDEGGGIKIGGEVPISPLLPSAGTGDVDIYNNLIQDNLANDDGGGIRLLMVELYRVNIYNNMIVNNISTHEGGGIALDDAPYTTIYNNTIMKNITTATASTSDGKPAPAGISTAGNSLPLQVLLLARGYFKTFSDPVLFNNITSDNRAGTWDPINLTLKGIGLAGDATPINYWDMGIAGATALQKLSPTNSVYQSATVAANNPNASATNTLVSDPTTLVADATYNVSVAVFPWRTSPNFIGTAIVATELPPNLMGNYHLKTGSPAVDKGAGSKTFNGLTVTAPTTDIDGDARPNTTINPIDIGADER